MPMPPWPSTLVDPVAPVEVPCQQLASWQGRGDPRQRCFRSVRDMAHGDGHGGPASIGGLGRHGDPGVSDACRPAMSLVLPRTCQPRVRQEDAPRRGGFTHRSRTTGSAWWAPTGRASRSLMKILAGVQAADSGALQFRRRARLGYLPQEIAAAAGGHGRGRGAGAVPGRDALEERLQAHRRRRSRRPRTRRSSWSSASSSRTSTTSSTTSRSATAATTPSGFCAGLGFPSADLDEADRGALGRLADARGARGAAAPGPGPACCWTSRPTTWTSPTLTWFDDFLRRSQQGAGAHLATTATSSTGRSTA